MWSNRPGCGINLNQQEACSHPRGKPTDRNSGWSSAQGSLFNENVENVNLDDTIVAIATAPGRGGIGIVRMSGPQAQQLAQSMLRLSRPLKAGRAVFAELVEPQSQERIDECVVTYF